MAGVRKDLRVGMDLDSSPMVRGLDKVLASFKGLDDEAKKSFGGAEQSSDQLASKLDRNAQSAAKFREALGGDFNAEAFQAYEQSVDRAAAKTKREHDLRVKLGADFDRKGFLAYERAMAKVERDQDRQRRQGGNKGVLGFAGGADRNLARAGSALGGVGSGGLLQKLMGFTKWPAIIAGAGAAAAALGALGAGAVALTSALGPLTGALAAAPALFSAYAQAAGTVKLALLGFKGGEQFSKELAKPTLAGARFSRFLKTLVPDVRRLQVTAQEGLFPGLEKGIAAAAKNLPVVQKIVEQTSKALGSLAASAGKQLGGKDWGRDLATQGNRNVTTITRLGKAAGNVANVLRHVTIAAGPLVSWLTKMALGWSRSASAAAQAGRQSGAMARFFERTRAVMTRLFSISGALSTAFYNIGKAAGPVGREILASLDKAAEGFARWTKSTGGQNALRKYFADAKPAIYEIGRLARDVTKAFFQLGSGKDVAPLIKQLRTEFLPVLTEMVKTASKEFLPALLKLGTEGLDLFNKLFGTSGPLTEATKILTKIVAGVNTLLEKFPQLHTAILVLGTVGGLYNILRIGAAITGVTSLIRLLRSARGLAAGTAAAGAVSGLVPGLGRRGTPKTPAKPSLLSRAAPAALALGRFAGPVGAAAGLGVAAYQGITWANRFAGGPGAMRGQKPNEVRRMQQQGKQMRDAITKPFQSLNLGRLVDRPLKAVSSRWARLRRDLPKATKGAWDGVKAEMKKSYPALYRGITQTVSRVQREWGKLRQRLPKSTREAWEMVKKAFRVTPLGRVVMPVVDKITKEWGKLRQKLPKTSTDAWKLVKQTFGKVPILGTVTALVDQVVKHWDKIKALLPKTGKEAWDLVVKTFRNVPIVGSVVKLVDAVVKNWDKIGPIVAATGRWLQKVGEEIKSWGPRLGQYALKLGQSLVDGFVNYLGNTALGKVAIAGAKLGKAAYDGAAKALERGSPSRVFMRLAKDTAEGFIVGLRQNERRVTEATRRTFGAAAKAAQQIMRGSGAAAAAFAGGRVRMQRDPSGALIPQGSGRGATNLRGLANQISSTTRTTTTEVTRLLANIRRQITQGMRRGATGAAMQGLRRAATVVTAEFSRRNKALTDRLKEQSAALKRGRTAVERGLRRRGVDIASEDGFKAMQAYSKELVDQLTRQAAALRKQMMAARRAGQRDVAATTRKKLFEVRDQLEETVTQMAEGARKAAAGNFGQYAGERETGDSAGGEASEVEDKREAKREKEEERKQAKEEARREKDEAKKAEREAERESRKEHDEAMRELSAELKANREWGQRMASVEEGTLRRALADVLSGEIAGAGFRPRAASAGVGSVARF